MQSAQLLSDLYIQTDQSVEHLTARFHFAMTRFLLPSFTLPLFFASMIAYLTTDGPCPECFVISFPALCVNKRKKQEKTIKIFFKFQFHGFFQGCRTITHHQFHLQ